MINKEDIEIESLYGRNAIIECDLKLLYKEPFLFLSDFPELTLKQLTRGFEWPDKTT